jgi:signal transduction histidine kinase
MTPVPTPPARPQAVGRPSPPYPTLALSVWRDPILLSAFLFVGLLAAFEVAIHLLHPPWLGVVNDWLLVVLAWAQLPGVVLFSWWLHRTHQPSARTWWLLSAALVCYALACTLLLVGDQVFFPGHPPFPWWSDLFFLLLVPFAYLALLLLPSAPKQQLRGLARTRVFLDSLLLMSAVSLLTYYFLVVPLSQQGGQSRASRITSLAYVIGELGALFILIVMFTYAKRPQVERAVLGLLLGAILMAMAGDLWHVVLNLPARRAPQDPSAAFWMLSHLLVPLAALVWFRLARRRPIPIPYTQRPMRHHLSWHDLLDALRFFLPFVVGLLASMVLLIHALLTPGIGGDPFLAWGGSLGLLALLICRQAVIYLDTVRLRREAQVARTQEQAASEARRQMETFLGIASHELKTPLATLTLHHELTERHIRAVQRQALPLAGDVPRLLKQLGTSTAVAQTQLARLNHLVDDLLDVSRIQEGRLQLELTSTELAPIVRAAVEEQRQLVPERTILLHDTSEGAVRVVADAGRIGQVVTNLLTNALKYSREERPVDVGIQVQVQDRQARVWVRDQGPGLSPAEQEHLWQRFFRVPGVEVRFGSGIGLGLGLYISKTIIEQHQGRVGVQSTSGEGATFWFTLPLAA